MTEPSLRLPNISETPDQTRSESSGESYDYSVVEQLEYEPVLDYKETINRLGDTERAIVNEASVHAIHRYEQEIDKLGMLITAQRQAPRKVEQVAERQAGSLAGALRRQIATKRAGESFDGFDEPVKNGIAAIGELQTVAHKLTEGKRITKSELAALGIQPIRTLLPRNRRQRLVTQVEQRINTVQEETLMHAGISDLDNVRQRAGGQAANLHKSTGDVEYVVGDLDEMPTSDEPQFTDDVLIAVAVGRVDVGAVGKEASRIVTDRLTKAVNDRMMHSLRQIYPRYVYDDHTLAGWQARETITSGLEQQYLDGYRQALLLGGLDAPAADAAVVSRQADWSSRITGAREKFERSVMPGDTVLEHYTPYLLRIVQRGGLQSKRRHGYTSINDRSELVHFTSRGTETGDGHSRDYSLYAKASGNVAIAMAADPTLQPVSGVLKMSLAEAIGEGLNCAVLTTKRLDGKNYVDDIVLADSDGRPQDIGLDRLQVVFNQLYENYGSDPRFVYDYRVKERLRVVREAYRQSDQATEWSDFLAEHFDSEAIARQLAVEYGADPRWVEQHVHTDSKTADEKLKTAGMESKRIVPLAKPYKQALQGEHVDGNAATHQAVYLGVVDVAA